ncbi:MAG TPA: HAMP domain-containing sensor histidine kinase [Ktedonobacterales bacterium]|nr:HAMP domain-containing sensor histidine kinase [Ktedonobacterales bacterium]
MKAGSSLPVQRKASPVIQAVLQWFQLNTRSPGWMHACLRYPLVGYLLVGPLVGLALLLDAGLLHLFPDFAIIDLPITLLVLAVALLWGAGPALFTTVFGTVMLYYVLYPPHFALLWKNLIDMIESGGVMIGGLFITLVISNHDAQRRMLQQRAQEEAELRQKMDAFLILTSHELRTPLTLLQLQLQMMQRSFLSKQTNGTDDSTRLENLLQQGNRQVGTALEYWGRLNQLVNNLLELARLQMEQQTMCRLQGVDLRALLKSRVEQQRHSAPYPTIDLLLPPGTPLQATADIHQIDDVLKNYLANAMKFSPEGTPITVGASIEGEHVRVWVRDHGPGLPETEHTHIWDCFYRAPGIEVQRGSSMGLGIGLYLCQQIIAEHHGAVGVDSTPGLGSTFWFTLPLSSEPPGPAHRLTA